VIGTRLVAFETVWEDWFLRAVVESLPKDGMRVGVFSVAIGWTLTSEDAGNVKTGRRENGRWQWRTCPDEMREKTGTDCSISEVSLHCKKLSFSAIFGVGEFHSSSLHILQLDLVCPIPMHVSDYPRIFEVNQGIVNKEMTSR